MFGYNFGRKKTETTNSSSATSYVDYQKIQRVLKCSGPNQDARTAGVIRTVRDRIRRKVNTIKLSWPMKPGVEENHEK